MDHDDIDRIMLAAMTEYEKANPESEESFKVRWARYRNKMYMREYRRRRMEENT